MQPHCLPVNDETLGPAHFAFGVPLRKLGLKIPVSRRVVLPLTPLETPEHGTVYWASFAEIATEGRDVDLEAIAAAKQEKAEQAKARKTGRGKQRTPDQGAAPEAWWHTKTGPCLRRVLFLCESPAIPWFCHG